MTPAMCVRSRWLSPVIKLLVPNMSRAGGCPGPARLTLLLISLWSLSVFRGDLLLRRSTITETHRTQREHGQEWQKNLIVRRITTQDVVDSDRIDSLHPANPSCSCAVDPFPIGHESCALLFIHLYIPQSHSGAERVHIVDVW